jgi:hypothetical protein
MIKAFDVLLPRDFPYALVSFQLYFENYGTGTVNLFHAAGMELIYEREQICYVYPENIFYQLLRLQNTAETHARKYELLVMKGWFEAVREQAKLEIVNPVMLDTLYSDHFFNSDRLQVRQLPRPGEHLALADLGELLIYHFFCCRETLPEVTTRQVPLIRLEYLRSCTLLEIVNSWLEDSDKLQSL